MEETLIENKVKLKATTAIAQPKEKVLRKLFGTNTSFSEVEEELLEEVNSEVVQYFRSFPFAMDQKVLYLSTVRHYIYDATDLLEVNTVINLRLINQISDVRYFLYNVNRTLPMKGYFLGCYESPINQKQRLLSLQPRLYGKVAFFLFFFLHRVIAKIPIIRFIYLILNGNGMRCPSKDEMETFLFKNGFLLSHSTVIKGRTYFISQKIKNSKKENLLLSSLLYAFKHQQKIIKF